MMKIRMVLMQPPPNLLAPQPARQPRSTFRMWPSMEMGARRRPVTVQLPNHPRRSKVSEWVTPNQMRKATTTITKRQPMVIATRR